MQVHPSFYVGVLGLLLSGFMFGFTYQSKIIGRDMCWIMVIASIATAVYGTFAGRKQMLTGSGKKMKDNYV